MSEHTKRRKKAVNGAGTGERRGALYWVRCLTPTGQRRRVPIPDSEKMTEAQARRAGAKLAADVRAGKVVFDATPHRGSLPSLTAIMTVRQLGEAWTSGKLCEQYPGLNRLRPKASAEVDAWTMAKHLYAARVRGAGCADFGDLPVPQVTTDDIAAVMAAHSKDLSARSRLHSYNRLHRLFDLAIFPCKLRKDNPVTRYLRPSLDPEKLFCFLYPSELVALLNGRNTEGATVVPIGRRVLYALAAYTGQRKGSL
jgi:hypothetical protein